MQPISIPPYSLQANLALAKHPWVLKGLSGPVNEMRFQSEEEAVLVLVQLQDTGKTTIAYEPLAPKSMLHPQPTPAQKEWAVQIWDWITEFPPKYAIGDLVWIPSAEVQEAWSDSEPTFFASQYVATIVGASCAYDDIPFGEEVHYRKWRYAVAPLIESSEGYEWEEFWIPEQSVLAPLSR